MLTTLAALAVTAVAVAAQQGCTHGANNHTVVPAKFAAEPERVAQNGKMYYNRAVDPPVAVVHLYGTPYERGYAMGMLMKNELESFFSEFYGYLDEQVGQYIGFIPEPLRTYVEEFGIWAALEFTLLMTRANTPQHFIDEIKGMADATGIDEGTIWRVNLLPELVKAHCTMVGAWATATSKDSTLLQLRALDFMVDSPMQKYPAIIVYHRDDSANPKAPAAYANMGWVGFVGAVTGMSSAPIGLSQKVWLAYNGTSSRDGYPFHFMLRDLLEFDTSSRAAHQRMYDSKRTCSVFVGVGDGTPGANQSQPFTISRYSHEYVKDYALDAAWPGHPAVKNMMYVNKHVQPSHDPCLGSLLQKYEGTLTADTLARRVAAVHGTGDLQAAVYDFAAMQAYVANAKPAGANYAPAYSQQFVAYNMTALFSEKL